MKAVPTRCEHAEKVEQLIEDIEMLQDEAVLLDNTLQVRQPRAQSLKCLSLTDPPIAASACSTTAVTVPTQRTGMLQGDREIAMPATLQAKQTLTRAFERLP